jgi:hypothetical protein
MVLSDDSDLEILDVVQPASFAQPLVRPGETKRNDDLVVERVERYRNHSFIDSRPT